MIQLTKEGSNTMTRLLAATLLLILAGCNAGGGAGQDLPSEFCEGFTLAQENMLRDSIEKAQDDGHSFEETLNQLRSFCPEGSEDCDQCVTALAEDVYGESSSTP
jgi:predicted small secreted protein